jgi:capsular exopolysaccharide synthesis family protein
MIVAFCILVTTAAGLYYKSQPDEYTAQSTLYVLLDYLDGMQQTRYDTTVSQQFAGDFTELIKTPTIMSRSMERLKMGRAKFSSVGIDINVVSNTRILRLNVTGRDPGLCMEIANTVSQVFIEYTREVMKADAVTIAAEASMPQYPSGPARVKNTLLAGVVSLLLVVGMLLVIEILNTTLRTVDAVESTLSLPVLASVQNYKKEIERHLQKRMSGELLSRGVSSITKENVKTLVTNIQFAALAKPACSLLVTSSIADEGKSSLLLLLAEAYADLGKRVLLVDMDLRNPSVGLYLGARGRNDLFDYLVGHSRLEEIICKTGSPCIHFIDSRHRLASVSQIVNFEVFQRFLDTVKQSYDLVLFDTPPLGLFIDAAALANKMDATLLVVGSGMGDRAVIKDVVEQLHKANANILGVALNYVEHPKFSRYYYNKKYGYGEDKKEGTSYKKSA